MSEDPELKERISRLEKKYDFIAEELDARITKVMHSLRIDDEFMKPAAEKFTDHASEHLLTKAGRKVFLWLVAFVAGAILLWAGSTRFWAS